MKLKFLLPLVLGLVLVTSCTKVEPGYVGIKVNQYGNQKGVDDFPITTGRVWYNPMTEEIYIFPTFRQNVVWTKASTEGSPNDDSITFNSIEGAEANVDIGLSYSLLAEKVPHIFVEFRKDIDHITHIYLRSEVRDAFSRHASKMKIMDIFGTGKQALLEAVKADLNEKFNHLGITFEMVSFVGAIRADQKVMDSISATIQATQRAIEAQNKILQSTAEANQAIEKARGEAESLLAVAKAQATANEIVTKSISGELLQYKMIEKWNGVTPQVTSNGSALLPMIGVK